MAVNPALAAWLAYWRYKQWYHRYTVEGLERLVGGGPALIVGYHGRPLAYDVVMLMVSLYDALGYMPHGIVHRGVEALPPLKAFFDAIGFVTGDGAALDAAIARGEHVVVTPGGAREGCRSVRHRYEVAWGDRLGYLRLALKHRLRIVPVAAAGADDGYIGLTDADALGKRLGLPSDWAFLSWLGVGPLGIWPFSPPFPVRMRQLVGEPIDVAAEASGSPDDRATLLALHERVTAAVQGLLDEARGGSGAGGRPRSARRSPTMGDITTILEPGEIAALRRGYDEAALNEALATTLAKRYALSEPYARAILNLFYAETTPDAQVRRRTLTDANRERCIISMLASHRERFTLAVHLYIGLMEEIGPAELANILLLAGVYSGIDVFTGSSDVARVTFETLKAACASGDTRSPAVVTALQAALGERAGASPAAAAYGTAGNSRSG